MRLMNADLLLQEALFVLITFKFFDVLHRGFEDGAFVLSDILGQAIVSDIIYSIIKLSTISAFSLLKVSICQLRCYQCSGSAIHYTLSSS